jgi:hypothetical protein
MGGRAHVEAVSGADVVEKRSNLVRLMRALFDGVLNWGEKLVYSGTKDESLPPKVLHALDAYLAESNSKLLVVLPLRDDREAESTRPPRSALLLESFEPPASSEQLLARLEVLGKHGAPALYNAVEHRRIPMRMIWAPLAYVQDGLGGKAKAILTLVLMGLVALVAAMILVPYPLKMDANGQLLPKKRNWIYTPYPGRVVGFRPEVGAGKPVAQGQEVILMHSIDLGQKIRDLQVARNSSKAQVEQYNRLLEGQDKEGDRAALLRQRAEADATYYAKSAELEELRRRTNADLLNPGDFWLKSPLSGIILSSDFEEQLKTRFVKEDEQLLRVGYDSPRKRNIGDWEVELKIPQKHVGQVLAAFPGNSPQAELDVDLLLLTDPTRTFKGKLRRDDISAQANPDKNAHDESEPVVLAKVRLSGEGIAKDAQVPVERLLTGTEVHARVRCGNHAMGYSLFYGVWEFIYEKIVFFF